VIQILSFECFFCFYVVKTTTTKKSAAIIYAFSFPYRRFAAKGKEQYAFKIFDFNKLTLLKSCKDFKSIEQAKLLKIRAFVPCRILKAYCSLVLRSKTTSLCFYNPASKKGPVGPCMLLKSSI